MPAQWTKRYAKIDGLTKTFLDISQYWGMKIYNKRIVRLDSPAYQITNPSKLAVYKRQGACKEQRGKFLPLDSKKSNKQEQFAQDNLTTLHTNIMLTIHDFKENPNSWDLVGEV